MHKSFVALGLIPWLLCPLNIPVRADASSSGLDAVVNTIAPSIVTVKIVLKTQYSRGGESQDAESRTEVRGTVVSDGSLVMISNASFSVSTLIELLGGSEASSDGIKIVPTDFKVVFAHDDTEYTATQVATDSVLGLTFLKITGPHTPTQATPVKFTDDVTPDLGEEIIEVTRMNKGYDYATKIVEGIIAGQIAKPRKAWIVARISELGLPIVSDSGQVLGILTVIPSGVQQDPSEMDSIMRMFGGGQSVSAFLIPAADINTVIAEAEKQAQHPTPAAAATPAAAVPGPKTAAPAQPTPPQAPSAPKPLN